MYFPKRKMYFPNEECIVQKGTLLEDPGERRRMYFPKRRMYFKKKRSLVIRSSREKKKIAKFPRMIMI